MHSARRITNCKKEFCVLALLLIFSLSTNAQENSPYSRYGLGDQLPSQNIVNRAMGGLAIPYYDLQSVNFVNPASYAQLKVTTFDIGLDFNSRTLIQGNPAKKYTASYLIPSYMQLGFPLSRKGHWGMAIGLRPLTRINYDLYSTERLPGIDTVGHAYKGNGGTYQAFFGMGFGTKRLTFGFNTGYQFGNKSYSTQTVFLNDSVAYKKAVASDTTRFGGFFVNGSVQYSFIVAKNVFLRLGANFGLKSELNALRDITRQTFTIGVNGNLIPLDSVYRVTAEKGTVVTPGHYGVGFLLEKEDKWLLGADYTATHWSQYRYYGQSDQIQDNWTLHLGGQFTPDVNAKGYWSRVTYRAGLSYGTDQIAINSGLKQYSVTFGTRFPIRRNFYTNQYTSLNTALEFGTRGNKNSSIRDNIFRISVGFSLSDLWFQKRKYD